MLSLKHPHTNLHHHHPLLLPSLRHSPLLKPPLPSAATTSSSSSIHCQLFTTNANPRTHNSSSTSLLLRSLQDSPHKDDDEDGGGEELGEADREWKAKTRLASDLSLLSHRRNPLFPGSLDFPRPSAAVSPDDRRALRDALEIRRAAVADVLKASLRSSKLSINYARNVVSMMPAFVDLVLVEAAELRKDPDFAHSTFNSRVKTYVDRSGVVPLVKWLKHHTMTYPQIGKLISMCSGKLGLLRSTVEWLKTIHVKGEHLGRVLVKTGPIWERGIGELDYTVSYLEDNGVRREWMGFVVSRCPQVLTLTMEDLRQRVEFYVEMGINEKDFGTMVFDYPKALGAFSLEEMNCKVNYLKEFGLAAVDVGRLLAYQPQLMGCSIEERWKPLVKYMYYLGIRKEGMKKMLLLKPMVFCVDLETTIAPKVRFLQDIGVKREAIGATLVKFPSLLTYSLYKKIRPVVIFLLTRAGVKQRDIGKVIGLEPELVGCSIANKLEIRVKYFLSLGIPPHSLGEMIADFPMLLKYNLDILRPKYRYLRRVMVCPLQDLIEFPRFFSYSLEGRIVPRHKIMVESRVKFKLRFMLAASDQDFDRRIKDAVESRRRFESGIVGVDSVSSDGNLGLGSNSQ